MEVMTLFESGGISLVGHATGLSSKSWALGIRAMQHFTVDFLGSFFPLVSWLSLNSVFLC